MNSVKQISIRHIEKNIVKYISLLFCFIAGVIIGLAFVFGVSGEVTSNVAEQIRTNCIEIASKEPDTTVILQASAIKNIRNIILIFIGGLAVWLTPINFAVLLISGFSYGFTVGYLSVNFGVDGFLIGFISVILNLAITIPVYIVLSVTAINNAFGRRMGIRQKNDFLAYVICFFIISLIIIIPVLCDAFVVPEIIKQICVNIK